MYFSMHTYTDVLYLQDVNRGIMVDSKDSNSSVTNVMKLDTNKGLLFTINNAFMHVFICFHAL